MVLARVFCHECWCLTSLKGVKGGIDKRAREYKQAVDEDGVERIDKKCKEQYCKIAPTQLVFSTPHGRAFDA